jgi:hypothetical protein
MGVEIATKQDLDALRMKLEAELVNLNRGQQEILDKLDQFKKGPGTGSSVVRGYISALEYMKAVGIKRWKFDQLIAENKIKTIKKKRKIYVPVGEVERYFRDPDVQ